MWTCGCRPAEQGRSPRHGVRACQPRWRTSPVRNPYHEALQGSRAEKDWSTGRRGYPVQNRSLHWQGHLGSGVEGQERCFAALHGGYQVGSSFYHRYGFDYGALWYKEMKHRIGLLSKLLSSRRKKFWFQLKLIYKLYVHLLLPMLTFWPLCSRGIPSGFYPWRILWPQLNSICQFASASVTDE